MEDRDARSSRPVENPRCAHCGLCDRYHSSASGAPPAARVRFVLVDRSNAHCPDQAQLRSAAVARLGYDPFVMSAPSTLYATISRTARGLRGEIRLEDPARENPGARQIESISGDCTELGKAMALAISIAIDPLRMSDGPSTADTTGAGTRAGRCRGARFAAES